MLTHVTGVGICPKITDCKCICQICFCTSEIHSQDHHHHHHHNFHYHDLTCVTKPMTILELLSTKVTLPASSTYDRSFLGPVGLDMVNGHWSMSLSWMLPCVAFHSLVMVLAMIMVRVRIMVEVMDTVIVMA